MRSVELEFPPLRRPEPGAVRVPDGEIHVWRAPLEAGPESVAELGRVLSPEERARVRRLRSEADRRRAQVSRGLLRHILAAATGLAAADIRFRSDPCGKPGLEGGPELPSLHFNLSHSAELLVVALSAEGPLGVDVERVRPVPAADRILRRLADGSADVPPGGDARAFLDWWTRREARAKATGGGLPALWSAGHPDGAKAESDGWTCYRFVPKAGFVGAIAIHGDGWRFRSWSVIS
ncbi:MAG: 4'-phosphopantetheinyl transferase family protein [Gemmatimonadota bacterium]